MTRPDDAHGPGPAVVAVTGAAAVAPSTEVVGTVRMAGGELVVHLQPSAVRDVTPRCLPRDPGPEPTTLAALPFMRYAGPPTAEQIARHRAIVARWRARQARPWWRRWWSWW